MTQNWEVHCEVLVRYRIDKEWASRFELVTPTKLPEEHCRQQQIAFFTEAESRTAAERKVEQLFKSAGLEVTITAAVPSFKPVTTYRLPDMPELEATQ